MKVILFYGKFYENQEFDWIPYGLLHLASYLIEDGYEPILITEFTNGDYEQTIRDNDDAMFLGISAMTGQQIIGGLDACHTFRESSAGNIIWGGAHTSATPEQTLKNKYVDGVWVGSFRKSLPQSTPFNLLDIEAYINPETRVLNYTSSWGCPNNCAFCSWAGSHPWRCLPIDQTLGEVEWLVRTYDLRTIWMSDATFLFGKRHALAFARGLLERKLHIYWHCNGSVRELLKFSRTELDVLEESGLDNVFVGVESASPRILKIMNKHHTNEQVDALVELTRNSNFRLYFSFIFGSPTETIQDLELTHDKLHQWMGINWNIKYQTSIFTPYPELPMTRLAMQHGFVPPDSLEGWGVLGLMNSGRDKYVDLPWFTPRFNEKYRKRFEELFPSYPRYEYRRVKC